MILVLLGVKEKGRQAEMSVLDLPSHELVTNKLPLDNPVLDDFIIHTPSK
jgi:hypothetical protein